MRVLTRNPAGEARCMVRAARRVEDTAMRALIVASALVLGLGVMSADAAQKTDGTLMLAQAGGGGAGGGGAESSRMSQSPRALTGRGPVSSEDNVGMGHKKKAKKKSKKRGSNM